MTAAQRRGAADLASKRGPGTPDRTGRRDENTDRALRRLTRELRPWRAWVIFACVLVVVSSTASLLAPWLQGVAIDDFITAADRPGLRRIIGWIVALYVVAWGASLGYSWIIASIAQRVMAGLRKQLTARLQSLSMRYFDKNRTGDLMSRVTNDVDTIDQLLSQNLLSIFWAVSQIFLLVGIMTVLDWRLTLAVLLPLPIVLAIVAAIGKRAGGKFGIYQRRIGELNAVAEERLSGQQTVIALDRQDEVRDEFNAVNEKMRNEGIAAHTLTSVVMPIVFGVGNLSTAAVVGIGGWLAVSGRDVTIGLIAAFVIYASRIGRPIGRISGTINAIYSALAGAHRVFELLDETPDIPDSPDAEPLPTVQGLVEFDDVTFSYEPGTPVLHNVTFTAQPGQMIGLVGPTGAGKSTIISVLNRFYDIDSGSVRVDGHDIRTVTKDSLRDQLGIVLQRTYLFTDTVRNNIRFGRLDATDDEVEDAARLANAHHFIRALPKGYDTVVSEGGTNLSLGQRQLLAIARAAIADPALLVLDEATSSVDTRTERDLQSALLNLMEGRTSFVIAHRLSTVRDADLILVLQDGRITESGTHDELVALDGFYNQLHQAQFRGHSTS